MNKINFFLDESGNTGNIQYNNDKFNFLEQPYFLLGAIEENDFLFLKYEDLIKQISKKKEVKANFIYNKKPEFITELLSLINDYKPKIFIEITEKKFFVCAQIVDYVIFYLVKNRKYSASILKNCANTLYDFLPDDIFKLFLNAIHTKKYECFTSFFSTLTLFLETEIKKNYNYQSIEDLFETIKTHPQYDDIDNLIIMLYFLDTYTDLINNSDNFYLELIPPEDFNKKGKILNSLVNLPSIFSIFFRINQIYTSKKIVFIHDQQDHFDTIFKTHFDSNTKENSFYAEDIKNSFELFFENSQTSNGIQIIDLIIGCLAKSMKDDPKIFNNIYNSLPKTSFNFFISHKLEKKLNLKLFNNDLNLLFPNTNF